MTAKQRLTRIAFFDVKTDFSSFSYSERAAIYCCVKAARILTRVYLRQINPNADRLRRGLEGDELRLFEVHGGPWDTFRDNDPFIPGVGVRVKGVGLYPGEITVERWDKWLADHPEDREAFESHYTVILPGLDDTLYAVPYNDYYGDLLEEAALELEMAADLLSEGNLKKFLLLQASAFRSNDYFPADMAWVDTDGTPFEVTIGPHEVYVDEFLGLKAAFEALVAIPDEDSTRYLKRFEGAVPEFDAMLAKRFGYKPKGAAIPLEVVRDIYRGGEMAFGRQFVALNLPNDRKVHELKGSKKVFSRTMMEAKFKTLATPIGLRLLSSDDQRYLSFNNRLLFVLGHELAHGLGPTFVERNGEMVPFENILRDLHSLLEEAKADTLGIVLLRHFYEKGLINEEELKGIVVTEVASYAQGWRMSHGEAHTAGSFIEYNWLRNGGAVRWDSGMKKFVIDWKKSVELMEGLAYEFLRIQGSGSYAVAEDFVEKWGKAPEELEEIVGLLEDIPIEVHPNFIV